MNPIVTQILTIWDERVKADREAGARRAVGNFEDKSGFDRQIFSRWRRGQNSAHIDSVLAIANTLGYDLVLQKRMTPEEQAAAKVAERRGCAVPPSLEDDWALLKNKRYTNQEAAAALGLTYFGGP